MKDAQLPVISTQVPLSLNPTGQKRKQQSSFQDQAFPSARVGFKHRKRLRPFHPEILTCLTEYVLRAMLNPSTKPSKKGFFGFRDKANSDCLNPTLPRIEDAQGSKGKFIHFNLTFFT